MKRASQVKKFFVTFLATELFFLVEKITSVRTTCEAYPVNLFLKISAKLHGPHSQELIRFSTYD
jgi:hypothetical protein